MNGRTIRFLFLGDPVTDRRIKNFIRYFQSRGWQTELLCSTVNTLVPIALCKELNAAINVLQHTRGPLMFWEHHKKLTNILPSLAPAHVTIACELYSLSAGSFAKEQALTAHLTYDARELYTELPTVSRKPLAKWFWKRIEKRGMLETDSVLVTAPLDAPAIQQVHRFLPRSFLIRNLPLTTSLPQKNAYLRERFSIPEDKHILVYIGGIQPHRGLEQMIDAMPRLRNDAVFVIIGSGSLRSTLEPRINSAGLSDCIFFHDAVASDDALRILASATIGISLIDTSSPSYELALPSKMYEYLLAGIPSLATPMKQVLTEFDKHPAIRYADLNSDDTIVRGVHELMEVAADTDLMRRIQEQASKLYTFEHDALPFAEFLEKRFK